MLSSPLGQWICLSHVQYKFYWTAQNLYIRRTDGRFDRHRNFRIFTRLFSRTSNISHLPETASPTTATIHSKFILGPDGTRGINGRDAKNDQSQTGALVSAHEQRILGDHPGKEKWSHIYQQLKNGKLVAATDGSYDQHTLTAAGSWVLATKNGKEWEHGACTVDGDRATLDSYRAELEAIRSLLYFIRTIRRHHTTEATEISLTLWVDNEQALQQATKEEHQ